MGFGNLGFSELAVIFLIILLLFGAKRLPEIGKSLGSGIREFKKAAREASADPDDAPPPPKSAPRTPPAPPVE